MLNYIYPKFQKPWIETTDKIRWTRQQRDARVANLHEPEAAFLYGIIRKSLVGWIYGGVDYSLI
jgi:hypothetical protein